MEGENAAGGEMTAVNGHALRGEQVEGDGVAGEGVDSENVEALRIFRGKRKSGIAFGDGNAGLRLAEPGEKILRDDRNRGIDFVEMDAVAGLAVGGEGSSAESDDADVARAALAAILKREADAGVVGVVGGGGLAELGCEPLRAVNDVAVDQLADGLSLGGIVGFGDAESAVEIAFFEQRAALVDDVQHDDDGEHRSGGHGPDESFREAALGDNDEGESGGDEEGESDVVVRVKKKRTDDADEEGSGCASGGNEEIEEGGFGGISRAERVGFCMAEEAGEEELGEEEADGEQDGEPHVDFGEHVAETAEHDEEEARDEPAAVEARRFKGNDEGKQIDDEREHPEHGDGRDILGQVAGDGAKLHGGSGGEEKPEQTGAEG